MNSFNNITKIKYEKSQKDLVTLVEYIIFADERNNEKYLVFKFQNNVDQYLNEIKFEISQYDEENNLISKSIISHGGFVAKENEVFVPDYKLKADQDCAKIEAKLLFARYERVLWENGVYTPIPYTASEFRNDYYRPSTPVKPVNKKIVKIEQKYEYKQFKKTQKKLRKGKNIYVKNIIKRNKTKFPAVLASTLSVIIIILAGVLTFFGAQNSTVYHDGGFDYKLDGNKIIITDYEGYDEDVVLPTTYTIDKIEYQVKGIGEKAFDNSNLKSITFTQNVTIADRAFQNCKKLEVINGQEYITEIGSYAFKNCSSLKVVTLENKAITIIPVGAFEGCTTLSLASFKNAIVSYGAFKKCKNLKSLNCYAIDGNSNIAAIFDDIKNISDYSLSTLRISQAVIPSNFTEGYTQLTKVVLTGINQKVEFGAFASSENLEGYINDGNVEILNNTIVAVKNKTHVSLPNLATLDVEATLEYYKQFAVQVESFTIDYAGSTVITKEHLADFVNLKSVRISKNARVSSDILDGKGITSLALSLDSNYKFNIPNTVTSYTIFDTGMLSASAVKKLSNLSGVTTLTIEDTVQSFSSDSPLSAFTNLRHLVTPNLFSGTTIDLSKNFGVSRTLTTLTIKNLKSDIGLIINGYRYLTRVDLSNSNITNSKLQITNCAELRELLLPEGLLSVNKTLVISCPQLKELMIPSTVTAIVTPLIGEGCDNLTSVTVPFIGKDKKTLCSYSTFNKSYYATETLNVTGEMLDDTENMFNGCKLKKLSVSIENITEKTFAESTINDLEIKSTSSITAEALIQINELKVLRLPSTEVAEMIDYSVLIPAKKNIIIYLNDDLPDNAQGYVKYFRTESGK
jgi:hypothetical protein